jgi:hypothetical protein
MDLLIESQKKMEHSMFFMSQQILNLQLQKAAQQATINQQTTSTTESVVQQRQQENIVTTAATVITQPPAVPPNITTNNNTAVASVDVNSLVNLLYNSNNINKNHTDIAYHQQYYPPVYSQPTHFHSPYYVPPFQYTAVKQDNTAFLSYLAHLSTTK